MTAGDEVVVVDVDVDVEATVALVRRMVMEGDILDKVLLLLARGVDGRGGADDLLGAAEGVGDAANDGGEDAEGELDCAEAVSMCSVRSPFREASAMERGRARQGSATSRWLPVSDGWFLSRAWMEKQGGRVDRSDIRGASQPCGRRCRT